MSLFDRRAILTLLAAAPLAGCGFSPVYAPGGAGLALRNQVFITPPNTRLGFELVARLEERLGRADAAVYELDHQIETTEDNLAITGANNITRVRINGTVTYTVVDTRTGAQVLADEASTFTAYSTTGTSVATAAAERDAEDRLMVALADQMVSRLLAAAAGWS